MSNSQLYIENFRGLSTPFYFYDMSLLDSTLQTVTSEASKYGYKVHYAVKANFDKRILASVRSYGLGADCVSGGEVRASIEAGFPASEIVFAGVGKSDAEILYGIDHDIFSFNCESYEELCVVNSLAEGRGKIANVALRINPDVDPKTHKYISTGKADNKFGVAPVEIAMIIEALPSLANINIVGLHFHVGSQVRDLDVFRKLCGRVGEIEAWFEQQGVRMSHINVGGGLGISYEQPDVELMPDFEAYFRVFHENLTLRPDQTLHFELGRSIVGQCGELISRVLYNKINANGKKIVIIDAGMTELIRPALYQAHHRIENISSDRELQTYTVVGPICESSDTFAKDIELPVTSRGDIIAVKSAGAYGRTMASNYNLREIAPSVYSDDL